jgi:uroporphyrin-III C-methyltransferase
MKNKENIKLLSLVGGGPGDPELITLKAIKTIEKADVILYDALINEDLLKYKSKKAIVQFVGKRYGCHTLSQKEINYLII